MYIWVIMEPFILLGKTQRKTYINTYTHALTHPHIGIRTHANTHGGTLRASAAELASTGSVQRCLPDE